MQFFKKACFNRSLLTILGLLLLAGLFNLMAPKVARAEPSTSLEITGDGVATPVTFTLSQLEKMEQYQYVYSAINTWPTKKWYVGKGVKLRDLLKQAGMKEDATLIKFTANDGYTVTLTVQELLNDKRYLFPHFKENSSGDGDGNTPGSPEGAEEVEPIIALVSVEGSNNPKYMNDINSLLLMLGQRAVTEQTGNLFVKYLKKIEVLTTPPEKWDNPQANPPSGPVPPGTMVALSNINMDDDKIYYTTDGSTPTVNSPMYNWIAKRWWPSRTEFLGKINKPIGPINQDTTIKAITIGPGKLNSDVVTFTYHVSEAAAEQKTLPLRDIGDHWAADSINKLVAQGGIKGYPDGTFQPNKPVTRAEFATVLVKAFKIENKAGAAFSDTAAHWAKDYIAAAGANGIVNGYDAATFGPDDLITREQMAVMIIKAAKLAPVAGEPQFADTDSISGWAREAIATATGNGIMKGYPNNTIRPKGSATRAEAVTVIMNALKLSQ